MDTLLGGAVLSILAEHVGHNDHIGDHAEVHAFY
jgi:hypothetical protein